MHRRTKPSNKKFRNEKAISYFWVLVLAGDFNLDETDLILFEFSYKNDSKNLARQKKTLKNPELIVLVVSKIYKNLSKCMTELCIRFS